MKLIRRRIATLLVIGTVLTIMSILTAGTAFASPHPPTNGGNGAGQSGQCTGPASERPASCQSSH